MKSFNIKLMVAFFMVFSITLVPIIHVQPARAGIATAKLPVMARVLPSAKVTTLRQVLTLTITDDDISRGFVEVPAASVLEILRNCHCMLMLELTAPFHEVEITGLGGGTVVSPEGMSMFEIPFSKPGTVHFELTYRFPLTRIVTAGTYPWPLTLSITPL